ncbi:AAA family ATPase [Velocimicrobium porci]|uniref:AAA domain-containing protein n=1 Tax=Velocimicrobium porci TaxID=2606634 RepID=A0A6L5XV85_9FIRM|nr:AAA family ATPase [Velocimicrobium porci]MSS62519.1 AAA domain-containing protein [Velocimicrobium porci]
MGIKLGERELYPEKNYILYGPPGTGKTYETVYFAVAIIENKTLSDIKNESFDSVMERYQSYKKKGQIGFTTFHQSYGYEEFIEGIRPVVDEEDPIEKELPFKVEKGIFQKFCEQAELSTVISDGEYEIRENPTIWKVSLCKAGENDIRTECMEHGHIRIGWDEYGEDIDKVKEYTYGGSNVLNSFINKMQIGDIVMSCYKERIVDAIGIVTGEYEWVDFYEQYKRQRKVKWLIKGIREDIYELNDRKCMTLSTVYRLNHMNAADILKIVERNKTKQETKKYVFVIDEINRGNISKIFGELITLLEPEKRLGKKEGLKTRLPYSGRLFGVPENVYVVGTMNTADRSIALMDTALRRRFHFLERLPDCSLLQDVVVEGVEIDKLLEVINKRIAVLYDREHTIGHSYFMVLKQKGKCSIETLKRIFRFTILPLLQEYFYDDYEKIRLVLGDNGKLKNEQMIWAEEVEQTLFKGENDLETDDLIYYQVNEKAFDMIEAYKKII